MLKRLLREPLVHFLAIAAVVFAIYSVLSGPKGDSGGSIVVTGAKIQQLQALFTQTRMRPPTPDEMKGLVDDYVAEELYVREAMKLGLDQDDTVIRRRLRQKMEFLTDAEAQAVSPTDADLETYLAEHPDAFASGAKFAFEQVYLDPSAHGDTISAVAATALEALRAGGDPTSLGDATLLPGSMPLSDATQVGNVFGPEFATAVADVTEGQWTGPIQSTFGLHLVRVTAAEPPQVPPLSEIRDAVAREWSNARIEEAERRRLDELLSQYKVIIEMPGEAKSK